MSRHNQPTLSRLSAEDGKNQKLQVDYVDYDEDDSDDEPFSTPGPGYYSNLNL
jgi:hypothetical protein